jgi:hypothetical protein
LIKVFLVLTAFIGGNWQYLMDEARPFNTIEECTAAATQFLNSAKDKLDDQVQAVAAECRAGISHGN